MLLMQCLLQAFPLLLLICLTIFIIFWVLHFHHESSAPVLHYNSSTFNKSVLDRCPLLQKPYIPTKLWGKSGHVQTILYGKMGRVKSPFPVGDRHSVILADGTTVTFDVFKPLETNRLKDDCMLVVCPGIANSSVSLYIRTYVDYAQRLGYHVAILNHLGAVPSVPLTSPRIYTYGCTEEYGAMVEELAHMFPLIRKIAVGFSMGGNIVMKYLGESQENEAKFIGAVSCCQGYDILEVFPYAMRWAHLRRMYVWAMTRRQISIISQHRSILFGSESQRRYGSFDVKSILSATSLFAIDQLYSYRRAGFQRLEDYYHWASSKYYLKNVNIPVLLMNALDDPLVPPEVHYVAKQFSDERENVIFAVTKHGGHLGYFEGGVVVPNGVTWMDKVIVEYADALVDVTNFLPATVISNSSVKLHEFNGSVQENGLPKEKS